MAVQNWLIWPLDLYEPGDGEFSEKSAIDCAILGGATTGEPYSFALGSLEHPQSKHMHVVVIAFRSIKPEPPFDPNAHIPPMAERTRAHLSRNSTFLITPYNTKLEFLGTWQEAAAMIENKYGIVEVQYEYLHRHMGTLPGAKAFTLYYVWYHFNYTVPTKDTNMRDTPTEYSAWNLAKFLQELKSSGAGMRAIGDLHKRLVEGGLKSERDVQAEELPDLSIPDLIAQARSSSQSARSV